jgi:hypothetical protein
VFTAVFTAVFTSVFTAVFTARSHLEALVFWRRDHQIGPEASRRQPVALLPA